MNKPSSSKAANKPANKPAATPAAATPAAADTLTSAIAALPVAKPTISAKQHIINLLSADGVELSIDQLCAASGKTAVNIRTMLSDLRNARYAGKYGVFLTQSTKRNGVTYYAKAKPAPAQVQAQVIKAHC